MKYNIEKGKGRGSIVFIHGNSSSSAVFNEVFKSESITQTKIVIDLPGHGKSLDRYKNDEDFSIQSYREKLIKFINTLDDAVFLVGNSLGGHIAIEIALHTKRLKGLLIFGTPPLKHPLNLEEGFVMIPELQTFFNENASEIEMKAAAETALFKKEHVPVIVEDFKKSNPKVRKVIATDVAENRFYDQFKIFKNLPVPKYIIAGTHDPSVNLNYLKEVAENSNSCELIMFEDCGHYPSLEKPKAFIEALERIANASF